ncbi:unnamed protein product [Clavelina lepadiformis]|uniref:Uncharacterized protein n=1 Tax=Clavelina lepadiformis TaxID=159417 RepID=A0ABP0FGN9_CLALP
MEILGLLDDITIVVNPILSVSNFGAATEILLSVLQLWRSEKQLRKIYEPSYKSLFKLKPAKDVTAITPIMQERSQD